MTIRFFNLFFYNDLGFSPDQNMALTVGSMLTLSLFTVRLQKLSVYFGRAQMVWAALVLNSVLTALISTNKNHFFIVGMFIIRGAVANSSFPIDRSILMDYVPSETRGRWNAVASMASTFWSGSALIGGWLSDKHGYRFTFLITAGIYLVSSFVYAPLMILVSREKLDTPSEQSSLELEMEGGEPLITA
jgi:MFS family permease